MIQLSLHEKINKEIDYYKNTRLEINPEFAQRQLSIVELSEFYYLSKFRDGSKDVLGEKKVFYNISSLPVEVAAKMLDIDTKDIQLLGENWDSYWASWIKSKELSAWLEEKYFGKQLNIYPLYLAKYGHLVVKQVGDDVMIVPMSNLIVRPNVEKLKDGPVIEKHDMPVDQFIALGEEKGWDNIEEIKTKGWDRITFYECWFPKGFLEEENNYYITEPNLKLDFVSQNKKDCPYKDLKWESIPGRFLGRGQIEKLFEDQIYINRIANYKAEGLHWSSKHLFQTRDNQITSNLLTDIENGEILTVNDEITPIGMEERNMGAYSYDEQRWENMAFRKTFTTEPVTGQRAPSGTPLGSTILQAQMTSGYYDQKKEDLGLFIEEILWDWVLPTFENKTSKEHKILMETLISGGDRYSNKFFNMILADEMRKKVLETNAAGKQLTKDQYEIIRGIKAEQLRKKELTIPKGYYQNLKHKIDIVITGEKIDTAAKLSTLQVFLQMIGSNPAMLEDRRIRRVIEKALDIAGFNPHEFEMEEDVDIQNQVKTVNAQRGGSVASPAPQPLPNTIKQAV